VATTKLIDYKLDVYKLSKQLGCKIRQIEKHYGHLEPILAAAEIAGVPGEV